MWTSPAPKRNSTFSTPHGSFSPRIAACRLLSSIWTPPSGPLPVGRIPACYKTGIEISAFLQPPEFRKRHVVFLTSFRAFHEPDGGRSRRRRGAGGTRSTSLGGT